MEQAEKRNTLESRIRDLSLEQTLLKLKIDQCEKELAMAETSKEFYENTIRILEAADSYLK